jgi:hypothetical protein
MTEGADPDWVMNKLIRDSMVSNIVGTRVTYHPYNKFNEPSDTTMTIELNDFLRMPIMVQNEYNQWKKTPIGEVYKFFPARLEHDTEEDYNDKVNDYLEKLMIAFRSRSSGGRKSGKSNKSKYLRTKLKRTRSKKINKRIKKRSCKRRR